MKQMSFSDFKYNYVDDVKILIPTRRGLERAEWRNKGGYEIDLTCGSDYSGSVVELSNYQEIVKEVNEEFPETENIVKLYGAFGSYGIGVVKDKMNEEELEWLNELEGVLADYVVLDDEAMIELEDKILSGSFRDNVDSELTSYVEKKHDVIVVDVPDTDLVEEELYEYGREKGLVFTETGAIPYIDWSRLFAEWESEQEPRTLMEFCEIDREDEDND